MSAIGILYVFMFHPLRRQSRIKEYGVSVIYYRVINTVYEKDRRTIVWNMFFQ